MEDMKSVYVVFVNEAAKSLRADPCLHTARRGRVRIRARVVEGDDGCFSAHEFMFTKLSRLQPGEGGGRGRQWQKGAAQFEVKGRGVGGEHCSGFSVCHRGTTGGDTSVARISVITRY